MAAEKCPRCGGARERGFISTTNGSGLFWAQDESSARLRPKGLEVLVPTGFQGTYSANLPAVRCPTCRTVEVQLPKGP